MKHLMIDLETLDVKHTAAFPSIAAIPFDLETGECGKPFYKKISLSSLFSAGLTVGAGTLQWWMDQNHEIMKRMFDNTEELKDVMCEFTSFIHEYDSESPWGNSCRFDLSILENAYTVLGMERPWKHWGELDYRTLKTLYGKFASIKPPAMAHDPVVDCMHQIERVCKIHKAISTNGEFNDDYGTALALLHDFATNKYDDLVDMRIKVLEFLEGSKKK